MPLRRGLSGSFDKELLPAYLIASTTRSSRKVTPTPNLPLARMMSRDARGAYLWLISAYEMQGAITRGCLLTIVVDPQGIIFIRSPSRDVINGADWGKKHGQRAW